MFRKGEGVCLTDSPKGTGVIQFEKSLHIDNPAPQFICLNPLDLEKDNYPVKPYHRGDRPRRADANVTSYRNLMLEMDGKSVEEQLTEIQAKRLPYTYLVYSGGKSVHAVICLTEGVTREEYSQLFTYLGYIFPHHDPTSKNPSRLTRTAGAIRDNQTEQSLLDVRRRISKEQLLKWIARFHKHIERCEQREQEQKERFTAVTGEGQGIESLRADTLEFLNGTRETKGSRHNRLVAAAFECLECGVDYEAALGLIQGAADVWGITADPMRANEGVDIVDYVYFKGAK